MFESIKAVAMDVDGVLTDGTFWWGANGDELKRFCFADVTGIPLAHKAGITLALISGESSEAAAAIIRRFAEKLKIAHIYVGCHDKAGAVRDFAQTHKLDLPEICFVGDDIQDLEAMAIVGVAAAPADAQPAARATARYVATRDGGHGAVREILDAIISAKNAES